jgi:uroporphyrinogen-III synthase
VGWLAGRTVAVTRSEGERADELAKLVEARGAAAVIVPVVRIEPLPNGVAALRGAAGGSFEWVICTSPRAAHALVDAWPHLAAGATPKLAAIGTATAAVLPRCEFVPATQSAAGLLSEWAAAAPSTVLVVQAGGAAATLADGLRAAGWQVTAVSPYRSVPNVPADHLCAAAMKADAVLFASGSAAEGWFHVFGTAGPAVRVAIGPHTSAVAERIGLKISSVSPDHSLDGLVDSADCIPAAGSGAATGDPNGT